MPASNSPAALATATVKLSDAIATDLGVRTAVNLDALRGSLLSIIESLAAADFQLIAPSLERDLRDKLARAQAGQFVEFSKAEAHRAGAFAEDALGGEGALHDEDQFVQLPQLPIAQRSAA